MGVIERLSELTEYVEEVTKLTARPYLRASQYKHLYVPEKDLSNQLGINLDVSDDNSIWLQIDRLISKDPPGPPEDIKPWITIPSDPEKAPKTKEFITLQVSQEEADDWVAKGMVRSDDVHLKNPTYDESDGDVKESEKIHVILRLETLPKISESISSYINNEWSKWSVEEIPVRKTIKIYHKMFSLQQSIERGVVDKPIEILWGIGISRWNHVQKGLIDHALLEIPVEIQINPVSASISIRSMDKNPRITDDLIGSLESDGAINFINFSREFINGSIERGDQISPFKKHTFEPILRNAATQIDQDGEYWPDKSENIEDRSAPPPQPNLIVTDTWAIYARPRSENFIIEDLRKQRAAMQEMEAAGEPLPKVAEKLVRSPSEGNSNSPPRPPQPQIPGAPTPPAAPKPIYLPKVYNQDQREILRKLDRVDVEGAVVQGPPGTGKTHTIANLICHYMATGRRVLVSSHGEGALSVLRDQIPKSVRGLTVSLLTNERAGIEQLESAVRQIERQTSKNKPETLAKKIEEQAKKSTELRQKIAAIDDRIKGVAQQHLAEVGGKPKRAWEWASWVVQGRQEHSWLEDRIGTKQNPKFENEHIERIKNARKVLGKDLPLVTANLPKVSDLPDPTTLASVYNDVLSYEKLSTKMQGGELPALATQLTNAQQRANLCKRALEALIPAFDTLEEAKWLQSYYESDPNVAQKENPNDHLERLFDQIGQLVQKRLSLLSVAVYVPEEVFELGVVKEISEALGKVRDGKAPFPIFFANKKIKELFNEIRIDGQKPDFSDLAQLDQITEYINWRIELVKFVARWDAVAAEFTLPSIEENGENLSKWLSDTHVFINAVRGARNHSVPTLKTELPSLFPVGLNADEIVRSKEAAQNALNVVTANLAIFRLKDAFETVSEVQKTLSKTSGEIVVRLKKFVSSELNSRKKKPIEVSNGWNELLQELSRQRELEPTVREVLTVSELVRRSGAPAWAAKLMTEIVDTSVDPWTPSNWRQSWFWRQWDTHLRSINQHSRTHKLAEQRQNADKDLQHSVEKEVELRTILELSKRLNDGMRSDLATVVALLTKMGKGTGKQARHLRRDARKAMERCYSAIPCWIMPSWRVSEMLPSEPGSFDLVIIDEASQSDMRELPVLLRGEKVLIVGDDKQVSPSAIGIRVAAIQILYEKYLKDQAHGPLMRPGFSLYDLFLAIFAGQKIMLREHFRCVEPIIRFSFQFYDEQIQPLRIPTKSERLDPPLIDVHLRYGFKEKNKTNPAEANFIVDEVSELVNAPEFADRSIGVVSLLGAHQAALIEQQLLKEIGEDKFLKHSIVCGDAATFQGKERDVMFVSMVAAPNDFRKVTSKPFEQRYNVALSRAKDRMYLVRSLDLDELQPDDLKSKVISHFQNPMVAAPSDDQDPRALCESDLERSFYDRVIGDGYRVRPQVVAGDFRIDFVIEGEGDRRLAVEVDGEKWHGPDRWWSDYKRQLALERMGWIFWRCWGSDWTLNTETCLSDLKNQLESLDIHPLAGLVTPFRYTEHRVLDDPPGEDFELAELEESEPRISVGDSVEVEFTDRDPPERFTYLISESNSDPMMGAVVADSDIGRSLIGASEGDDIVIPVGSGENAIIVGIFKGAADAAPDQTSTSDQAELNLRTTPDDHLTVH